VIAKSANSDEEMTAMTSLAATTAGIGRNSIGENDDGGAPQPVSQPPLFPKPKTRLDEAVDRELGCGMSEAGYIVLPSLMPGFRQTGAPVEGLVTRDFGTSKKPCKREVAVRVVPGALARFDESAPHYCPDCGRVLEGNGPAAIELAHLPMGSEYTRLSVSRPRMRCPDRECGYSVTLAVPFKADGHNITAPLHRFVCDLLAMGQTLKDVSLMTGLHKGVVKDIDKKRLEGLYTEVGEDGARRLKGPERQSRFLGIDEFKLHDGRRYATVIIDLEDGRVLWLAHTKKKQVVRDFCDFVGDGWMSGVVAVACDMNADFERAFTERHPHLRIVYDRFHLVKNFNDKVISEVRKDEQRRLREEGREDEARALKGSKYILMTKASTRREGEADAASGKVVSRGSELFGKPEVVRKPGSEARYRQLIEENELLATCDIVKEMLEKAYSYRSEGWMRRKMRELVDVCRSTGNRHFEWFARLVEGHMDGIVSHAKHPISSGKVEGTNNMIKTLRRKGYGYPDDEYFFLKIYDGSRRASPGGESPAA